MLVLLSKVCGTKLLIPYSDLYMLGIKFTLVQVHRFGEDFKALYTILDL